MTAEWWRGMGGSGECSEGLLPCPVGMRGPVVEDVVSVVVEGERSTGIPSAYGKFIVRRFAILADLPALIPMFVN